MSGESRAAKFGAVATTPRTPAPAPPAMPTRKYTVLLDGTAADAFDETVLTLRRRTGQRVDKSQVVRELVQLLSEDPTLVQQLADRLAQKP